MMFVKKINSKKFTIAGGTEGSIYPSSQNGDFTIAHVSMDGIYPQKGFSINNVCTETLFLIEGEFEVEVDGELYNMTEGDLLSIEPNKKYKIKGSGQAIDFITPAWEKNKNRIVD